MCPHAGVAGGRQLPFVIHLRQQRFRPDGKRPAIRAAAGHGEFAAEAVLGRVRQRVVLIGAADHPELEWVDAGCRLQLQSGLERLARIFALEPLVAMRLDHADIRTIPAFEIRELIVRRQKRMRFAVALDLRDLEQSFEVCPGTRIVGVERRAIRHQGREHAAATQVRIMRNAQHAPARLPLVGREYLPQILGMRAVEGAERLVPQDLFRAVGENHHAMEIVAARHGRPLVTDQRGKHARLVGRFGVGNHLLPDAAFECRSVDQLGPLRQGGGKLEQGNARVAPGGRHVVVPAPPGLGLEQVRIAVVESGLHAEVLGVIGHDEEIQRPFQHGFAAAGQSDPFAFGEAVGRVRA